jgi:tetratricopeptide (TPR) repeat protein
VSLRALLQRGLSREVAAYVVRELAEALAYVHAAVGEDGEPLGIVHRDVGPSNVLVSRDGEVKLADFGIAKLRDAVHRTRTGAAFGTRVYMSPEQHARGIVSAASDVWAAGVVLWEATVGRRLFDDDDGEVASRIRAGLVTAPSSIDSAYPAGLEQIVMSALHVDATKRPTAAQLAAQLGAWIGDDARCRRELAALVAEVPSKRAAPEATRMTRVEAPARSRSWHRRIGLGVLVAAVPALVYAYTKGEPRARQPAPAVAAAWAEVQHGGHERARVLVDELLAVRPRDPEVATLAVLVHWWLGSRQIDRLLDVAEALPLDPAQRALVRTLGLLHQGRPAEAVGHATLAEQRHPGTAAIAYVLGEASWHAGDREGGVKWLERAVERDPRWQVALAHVVAYRAAAGDAAALRALATTIAGVDTAGAAVLDVQASIVDRDYERAVARAREVTPWVAADPRIWLVRARAGVLAGELDDAARSAAIARAWWPVDDRDDGAFAVWTELYLYRGDEEGFVRAVGARGNASATLRPALWHDAVIDAPLPIRTDHTLRRPGDSAMAPPPLSELLAVLGAASRGADAVEFYRGSPYPDVRAFGEGLAAARTGDHRVAARWFQTARDQALADTRPLVAFWLARSLRALGDLEAAGAACDDVRRPRAYVSYRALLLRECGGSS